MVYIPRYLYGFCTDSVAENDAYILVYIQDIHKVPGLHDLSRESFNTVVLASYISQLHEGWQLC